MERKMNQHFTEIKIAILRKYPTQGDFAQEIPVHESFVSQVLRGRRQLSPSQAERWVELLNCQPEILASVTR
jgi:plasmid maintenance system antidote protein VapI